ncbi:hypothetical protein [Acinetobacter sp. c1-l78]|uniref:hypothetical protein n=1 Tax=Acinetobacter sp. c1-l78 TaxID=3342803 RepID=UPI0035B8CD6B
MHQSRLKNINQFEKMNLTANKFDSLQCRNASYQLNVKISKVDLAQHTQFFKKNKDGTYSNTGKAFVGSDGELPISQYQSIDLLNLKTKQKQSIAKTAYEHLFNPSFFDTSEDIAKRNACYFDAKRDRIYWYAQNSDGAGSYEMLMIFEHGQHLSTLYNNQFNG